MPYKVKGKCVYKKDGGAKVGCTTGSVKRYLAALHANANEAETQEETITETNLIKGGKADKLTAKDIADKFNVPVSKIEAELRKGKKVEHEHTNNMGKATEIAMDHLSEFPDYYTRLAKMEKEAEKHAKKLEMNEDTKSLIKGLLREAIDPNPLKKKYLLDRIPFLKSYKVFDDHRNQGRVEAQKIAYHQNVKKMVKGEVVVFPQYNSFSEFIYYPHVIDDNVFHNFIIKNQFVVMPPIEYSPLEQRVIMTAMNMLNKNLSFNTELITKVGEPIDENKLNDIINQINKKLFEFEEISEKNNVPLF